MSTRRIFGLETEFGITCATPEGDGMGPEEVARLLFKKVVAWGRSSNVFLRNGSRLYLDVGSHPEYATAECDSVPQLIAHDRGGERIMEDLVINAQAHMEEQGIPGRLHMFKNNTDSSGNSYGCHENYLVRRQGDFNRLADILVPFLISRQVLTGAGKILETPGGSTYAFSQRADHIWEAVSSASTRSRPIINTRDEPHADAEYYRRLHVIVGDSSMAQPTALLKVGATDMVLRMIEAGIPMTDLGLENPMRAIREVSHDLSGQALISLSSGRTITAAQMQGEYLAKVRHFVEQSGGPSEVDAAVFDLWERGITAVESQDFTLVDHDLDWAIKHRLLTRYQDKLDCALDDPRIARLDLAYHDISRIDGLFAKLESRGLVNTVVPEDAIAEATQLAPQTTRAKLRGEFVTAAQAKQRDYMVDWVHMRITDESQRSVACKDPFAATDTRVEELIASL